MRGHHGVADGERVEQRRVAAVRESDDADAFHGVRMLGAVSEIDRMLEEARRALDRVEPAELDAEVAAGAWVVDTRPEANRRDEGELPGAIVIERTVLEWRLDPSSPHKLPGVEP